ncbi:trypsin-like peptidase domain-containing protein [Roseicitreum antarcticum]|nr:trypsin-like peptidase domain-containing protein [Roseicitreum antarcticum]
MGNTTPPAASAQMRAVPQDRTEVTLSFAPVVRAAAPAVVSIYARRLIAERRDPFADDPVFGNLFRDFGRSGPRAQNALGSGVIVSPEGIVVSNFHVVGGADEIRVVLNDGHEYDADIILSDEESDLAVLQMRGATGLPTLALRDSDSVEVGDLVLAIGNPFGVGQTVSGGIVSAMARSGIGVGSGRGYFIQTDAAINPGNSGGALVDLNGDLLGINTAIITQSGGSVGIGFAIPANLVAQVVAQAQAGRERFTRPWAGISAQAVDATLAEAFGLSAPRGVAISQMHPQSPLVAAGMQPGDIVLAVDGAPVNTAPEMMFRLSVQGIDARAALTYLRDGETLSAEVALAAPPEAPPRNAISITAPVALRGLQVAQVNPGVITEMNLPLDSSGVVVADARDWAARAGLRAGDLILQINTTRVSNTADVARAAQEPTRNWLVEVMREGRKLALRFRI